MVARPSVRPWLQSLPGPKSAAMRAGVYAQGGSLSKSTWTREPAAGASAARVAALGAAVTAGTGGDGTGVQAAHRATAWMRIRGPRGSTGARADGEVMAREYASAGRATA